jgi:hypothetical protein
MSGKTSDKRKSLYISDLPPPNFGYNAAAYRPLRTVGAVGGNGMDSIIFFLFIVLSPMPEMLWTTALQRYGEDGSYKKSECSNSEFLCSNSEKECSKSGKMF